MFGAFTGLTFILYCIILALIFIRQQCKQNKKLEIEVNLCTRIFYRDERDAPQKTCNLPSSLSQV